VVEGRAGSKFSRELISRSGYEREGFALHYDRYRPRPPAALFETLLQLARTERPALVVDLGAGTGLSTRPWAALAERVVGVEPNSSMRDTAEGLTPQPNVEFVLGFSHETGLPDACADVVTASQSPSQRESKDRRGWPHAASTRRALAQAIHSSGRSRQV